MTAPIPEPRLQAYLAVHDAAEAIRFYVDVFGMTERYRLLMDDGRVGHAELTVGACNLLLANEFPEYGVSGPKTLGGVAVSLLLYVEAVDAFVDRAVAAGCLQTRPTKDEFFGDRTAQLEDPFGHRWFIHQRLETLSVDEIRRRAPFGPA